jgi:hypothetical protein
MIIKGNFPGPERNQKQDSAENVEFCFSRMKPIRQFFAYPSKLRKFHQFANDMQVVKKTGVNTLAVRLIGKRVQRFKI